MCRSAKKMGNCLGKVASRVMSCIRGRFGGVHGNNEGEAPPANNNNNNNAGASPQPSNHLPLHTVGYPGRGVIESFPTLRQRRHPAVEEYLQRGGTLHEDDGYKAPAPRKVVEVQRVALGASVDKSSFQLRPVNGQAVGDTTTAQPPRNRCVLSFSIRNSQPCRLRVFSQSKLLPAAQGSSSVFTRRYQDIVRHRAVGGVHREGPVSTPEAKWIEVEAKEEADQQLVEVTCAPALVPPAEQVLSQCPGPVVVVVETANPVPVRQYFTLCAPITAPSSVNAAKAGVSTNSSLRCHVLHHEIEVAREGAVRMLSEAYGMAKVKSSRRQRGGGTGTGGAEDPNPALLDGEGRCAVCWSSPAAILTEPCGHVCMCEDCAARCPSCPLCRAAVTSHQTIQCT